MLGGIAMTIRFYNTLTRSKEEFVPAKPGVVTVYVCGPTVYNFASIGNFRPAIIFDVLRRYLEYRGFEVRYVHNITDVEDKIIRRAAEEGISTEELSARYAVAYAEDAAALGIEPPTYAPKATEFIPQMIDLIQGLIDRGHAYVVDGDVYFDTHSFPGYGKLSRQSLEHLEAGARVDIDERKRHPADFALWKSQKPGEPAWEAPWGKGRPGWHIECSAMTLALLGPTIDIHAGGTDLIFPHHENEIAQSEAFTGQPFARFWLHNEMLNLEGEKMSKSLGNTIIPREMMKHYPAEAIRLYMLSSHYRSSMTYNPGQLDQARAALGRLYNSVAALQHKQANTPQRPATAEEEEWMAGLATFRTRFIETMDDDLNTAGALGILFELVREANGRIGAASAPAMAQAALKLLVELGGVLGLLGKAFREEQLDAEVEALIVRRQQARKEKNWAVADRIRDELAARGIILEDTPGGVRWKRR